MSSTYSINKCAGVFQTSAGPFYVLFEETAESNVYPREPQWCCITMGYIEDVLRRVFAMAGSCEGGSLKGAGGRAILPETYIGAWLKALANPYSYPDQVIQLHSSNLFSSPVPAESTEQVFTIMAEAGHLAEVESLQAGVSVNLSLHNDHGLLSRIYNGDVLGSWRVIPSYCIPSRYAPAPELAYQPSAAITREASIPELLQLNDWDATMLKQDDEGHWRAAGRGYSLVADYVRQFWTYELQAPGSYRRHIKTFRQAVRDAPTLPHAGVKVVVNTAQPVQWYMKNRIDQMLETAVHTRNGDLAIFNLPQDPREIFSFCSLPAEAAYFDWDDAAHTCSPRAQGSSLLEVQMAMPGFE